MLQKIFLGSLSNSQSHHGYFCKTVRDPLFTLGDIFKWNTWLYFFSNSILKLLRKKLLLVSWCAKLKLQFLTSILTFLLVSIFDEYVNEVANNFHYTWRVVCSIHFKWQNQKFPLNLEYYLNLICRLIRKNYVKTTNLNPMHSVKKYNKTRSGFLWENQQIFRQIKVWFLRKKLLDLAWSSQYTVVITENYSHAFLATISWK